MDDIDFSILASQDADFAKILKSNGQLDFSNPEAVLQLTKSLLKQHFNLRIELPPDRLCPPVPNRLNYIKWIQELLNTTSSSYSDVYEPNREVIGLDIGTGASCIYPLLGCASRPGWKFIGTDIDDKSFQFAQQNVQLNNLDSKIKLLKTTNEGPLIPLDILGIETIDFTVCNPPFYTSTDSLLLSCAQKSRPPFTACTGSTSEMIYPGGEVAFLTRLINESLQLKERVQWYTSMLGKLESLKEILVVLKGHKITNIAVKELIQGTKTRRWAVAWSHSPLLPSLSASRGIKIKLSSSPSSSTSLQKQNLPFPTEFSFRTQNANPEEVDHKLSEILTPLPISIHTISPSTSTSTSTSSSSPPPLLIHAPSNVWSRASRRQAQRQNHLQNHISSTPNTGSNSNPNPNSNPNINPHSNTNSNANHGEKEMAFVFKISVFEGKDVSAGRKEDDSENGKENALGKGNGVEVVIRWVKGRDSVIFESFCGMVRRRVEEG